MFKKTLLPILLGCSLASPSFALNMLHLAGAKKLASVKHKSAGSSQKINLPSTLNRSESKNQYTDFSGTWAGVCFYTSEDGYEEQEDVTLDIKNDYENITIDNEEVSIGGFKTTTETNKDLSIDVKDMVYWGPEGNSLLIDSVFVLQSPWLSTSVFFDKENISLKNGQLIIASESISFDNKKLNSSECVLNRQAYAHA